MRFTRISLFAAFALGFAFFCSGCAGFRLKPPEEQKVQGVLPQNTETVWSGVVVVVQDVLVPKGATLVIQPGTRVVFRKSSTTRIEPAFLFTSTELLVRGRLIAQGTPEEPIVFTSAEDSPAPGDWAGIVLDGLGDGAAVFKYCHIEYATQGIYCINSSPTIKFCRFKENEYAIVCQRSSFPEISNCTIQEGQVGVASWDGSAPKVMENLITGNRQAGILWTKGAVPWFEFNIIRENRYGVFGGEEHIWTSNQIEGNEYDFYLGPE